jgi:hypothetical protein
MERIPLGDVRRVQRLSREQVDEAVRTGTKLNADMRDVVVWYDMRERTCTEVSLRSYLRNYLKRPDLARLY